MAFNIHKYIAHKKLYDKVRQILGSDEKALEWFTTENPELAHLTPVQLIQLGRFDKVSYFVNLRLSEPSKTVDS